MAEKKQTQKTAGNSAQNYWARLRSYGGMTPRKAARVKASAESAVGIAYGTQHKPRPLESVVFSGAPSENFPKWGIPPVFVISDGVTLGVYPRETDALSHFNDRRPGTFARVATGEKIPESSPPLSPSLNPR